MNISEQAREATEVAQRRTREAEKAKRMNRIWYLALIPAGLAIGALVALAFRSYATVTVLVILTVLGAALLKVYHDAPYPSDDRANTMPPSLRERYIEARQKLLEVLRDRRGVSDEKSMVRWIEREARNYGTELTPEQAQALAQQFSYDFGLGTEHILPHHREAVEEFLLMPLNARQEAIREVPWQVDTIRTSKGAAIAAHPDADLAKYAAHFGVEVNEVEQTWKQQTDPAEAIFQQLATSATSLVQLEIQLEGILKKYNVDSDSEVGQNIRGIYRAAAAHFADPDSR